MGCRASQFERYNSSEMLLSRNYGKCRVSVFEDSSQKDSSAVAFLRARMNCNETTGTQLAFVFGKARVAPMKALTIPK